MILLKKLELQEFMKLDLEQQVEYARHQLVPHLYLDYLTLNFEDFMEFHCATKVVENWFEGKYGRKPRITVIENDKKMKKNELKTAEGKRMKCDLLYCTYWGVDEKTGKQIYCHKQIQIHGGLSNELFEQILFDEKFRNHFKSITRIDFRILEVFLADYQDDTKFLTFAQAEIARERKPRERISIITNEKTGEITLYYNAVIAENTIVDPKSWLIRTYINRKDGNTPVFELQLKSSNDKMLHAVREFFEKGDLLKLNLAALDILTKQMSQVSKLPFSEKFNAVQTFYKNFKSHPIFEKKRKPKENISKGLGNPRRAIFSTHPKKEIFLTNEYFFNGLSDQEKLILHFLYNKLIQSVIQNSYLPNPKSFENFIHFINDEKKFKNLKKYYFLVPINEIIAFLGLTKRAKNRKKIIKLLQELPQRFPSFHVDCIEVETNNKPCFLCYGITINSLIAFLHSSEFQNNMSVRASILVLRRCFPSSRVQNEFLFLTQAWKMSVSAKKFENCLTNEFMNEYERINCSEFDVSGVRIKEKILSFHKYLFQYLLELKALKLIKIDASLSNMLETGL